MSEPSESSDKAARLVAEMLKMWIGRDDKTTLDEALAVANQASIISETVSTLLEESKELMQLAKTHDDVQVASGLVTAASALAQALGQERKRWDARAKALAAPKP